MMYGIIDPNGSIKETSDVLEWAMWYESCSMSLIQDGGRVVCKTALFPEGSEVSTVFLGINMGFGPERYWFETMIFGGEHDGYCDRCGTLDEAHQSHRNAVELVAGEPALIVDQLAKIE